MVCTSWRFAWEPKTSPAENRNGKMFNQLLFNNLTFWRIVYIQFFFLSNMKFMLAVWLFSISSETGQKELRPGPNTAPLMCRTKLD